MKKLVLLSALVSICFAPAPAPSRDCTAMEFTPIESLDEFEGVWYVVAHKHHKSFGKKSSTVKLEVDGDKLKMTEFHVNKDGECHGPIPGTWTKTPEGGFNIELTAKGKKHEMKNVHLLKKYQHPHHEQDQAFMLFGCATGTADVDCPAEKQTIAIFSKFRRPATQVIYNMAQFLKEVCLDPLSLRRFDTSSDCGNDIVSESHQASSEESTEAEPEGEPENKPEPEAESEAEPSTCIVPDMPGIPLTEFKLEPYKLYLVATNAPWFKQKGVRSMTVEFKGQTEGEGDDQKLISDYQVIIHGVCYKGLATERADPDDPTGATFFTKMEYKGHHEKTVSFEVKEKVIYMRHGLIVSYRCDKEHPEGGCLTPIFHVWSTEEHVQHGALLHMYDKAKEHCTDPANFVFLNTHAECSDPVDLKTETHHHHSENEENTCKIEDLHLAEGLSLEKLKGTWFVTAVTMSDRLKKLAPHFHQGSFTLKLTDGDKDTELNGEYYEDMPVASADQNSTSVFKGAGECKHGNGKVKIYGPDKEAAIKVTAQIDFGGKKKNFKLKGKVLHVGPELLLVYNCYEKDSDGKCKSGKAEAALLAKSRHLRHHDRLTLFPHYSKTCIYSQTYFMNLHSHCGMPLDEDFHSRHGYMALRHDDVLDIVGKSAQKKCKADQLVGQFVCLKKFASSGPWYLHATNGGDMYGFYGKYKYETCGAAAGKGVATVMVNGEKQCVDVDLFISYHKNELAGGKKDHYYRVMFSSNGVDHIHDGRFIWTNYKLGVFYTCEHRAPDGSCARPKVFLLGRHETLDHHEWMVLENLFKALCIDMKTVHHLSPHENCLHDSILAGKKVYKVAENCDWESFSGQTVNLDDMTGVFHDVAVAHKNDPGTKSHVYKTTKDGDKLKMDSHMEIKEECRKYTGSMKNPGEEGNGLELKYKSKSTGKDQILRYWLGGKFGPYYAMVGCHGAECGEDTGFASIVSKYRVTDPIALHQTYKWFADHCVDPQSFKLLDTHSNCGKNLDNRSCKVADIAAVEADPTKATGKWYITAMNKRIFKSVVCQYGDDASKSATCHATFPLRPGCHQSSFKIAVTPEGHISCDGKTEDFPTCSPGGGPQGKVLYQKENHMLSYYCLKENKDGSCMIHETFVILWAKTATVSKDTLPGDLLEKLDQACIPTSTLRYSEETDCGA